MQRAEIDLFTHVKIADVTKKNYLLAIRQFKDHSGIKDLRKVQPKVLKEKLVEYVIYLKQNKQSYSKQNIAISAVQKFCGVYDIAGINWENVRGFTSDNDVNGVDRPYTKEELRSLIEFANPRTKAIILLMLSAGLRIGAVPHLRIKHLKMEKYGVYKVTAYADSKRDNYISFTTPEAAKAIDDYLKSRTIKGEKLKPDSPLFRKEFDIKYANTDIEPITKSGLFKLIQELAVNIGKRTVGHKARSGNALRHETPLTHSFRKIANTAFVKAGIKPIVVEKLLGHNIGLQANYLRLSDEDLLEEYLKAIDFLTVSEAKVLQKQVEKLKTQTADIDVMKKLHLDLKLELEHEKELNTRNSDALVQLADQNAQLLRRMEALENNKKS